MASDISIVNLLGINFVYFLVLSFFNDLSSQNSNLGCLQDIELQKMTHKFMSKLCVIFA